MGKKPDPPEVSLEYDVKKDTLYIEIGGEMADDSYSTDDGLIVRLQNGRVVGLTIRHARRYIWELLGEWE